jgi:DNA polymerase-1
MRNAINSPLQGSAADIIKLAMIRIHQMIQTKQVDIQLILQVHDELVFEVKKTDIEAANRSIKIAMEHAYIFEDVALEIEIGEANNWLQAH